MNVRIYMHSNPGLSACLIGAGLCARTFALANRATVAQAGSGNVRHAPGSDALAGTHRRSAPLRCTAMVRTCPDGAVRPRAPPVAAARARNRRGTLVADASPRGA
ncbi:exported hypothetical protein [Cupriavidus taiwanensis]|nr:exported hypothetical protein [Cupriavidus taiwanensis]SOY57095.1 exported hypothetical protein [Cupriavidus taiwanensis]SOY79180.1 exported hypothetical protein [Cupriavidus taiwanensis]SOZ64584.1 exported hypothetical protein [Cupriavidus taiwanensis]SOZ83302.1 exported hypothetical protein [Cupriavidus taiwanensis]